VGSVGVASARLERGLDRDTRGQRRNVWLRPVRIDRSDVQPGSIGDRLTGSGDGPIGSVGDGPIGPSSLVKNSPSPLVMNSI
jgi:hypothetical protein